MARDWNLFAIGRRSGDEDQLTGMLVWLASAVPAVRTALVELALQVRVDPERVEARTEYWIAGGRLDALLEGDDVRLIIESKLGSAYGEGQIGKYLRWLADRKSSMAHSGLMTLTVQTAPWDQEDTLYARHEGLVPAERRWEDLHELLQPVIAESPADSLESQMVREFLDVLEKENLVPVRPLDAHDLGTVWADSWRVVARFRDFFHACKEAIGESLSGTPMPNRWSDKGDWFYQDYGLPDTTSVVVGLLYTDELDSTTGHSRSPILWIGINADHLEKWTSIQEAMRSGRPDGWREGRPWYGRPVMWRPLAEVLSDGTFEDQCSQLADAVSDATRWLSEAVPRAGAMTTNMPEDSGHV